MAVAWTSDRVTGFSSCPRRRAPAPPSLLMNDEEVGSFDHTADVGIRVTGSTLEALFAEAARAALRIAGCDPEAEPPVRPEPPEWRFISIEAADVGMLLVRWIQEVLFLLDTEDFVCESFDIEFTGTDHLKSRVEGRVVASPRIRELKGVTYHGLSVKETQDGWSAQVVFDV